MRLHLWIMSSSGHRMTSPFLKGHLEVFPADAMTSKRPFSGRRQAGGGRRRQARLSCQRRGRGGCTARLAAWHGLRGIGHRLEPPAASRHHYGVVGQAALVHTQLTLCESVEVMSTSKFSRSARNSPSAIPTRRSRASRPKARIRDAMMLQ